MADHRPKHDARPAGPTPRRLGPAPTPRPVLGPPAPRRLPAPPPPTPRPTTGRVPAALPIATAALAAPELVRVRTSRLHRLTRGPRRTARRFGRWTRTPQGKWTAIGLVCAAVILIGLLGSGFLHTPAPAPSVSGGLAAPGPSGSAPPSSPRPSPRVKPTGKATGLVTSPLQTLKDAFIDNPLNHLRGPGLHKVVISATSSQPIAVVGYLVPTGLGAPYASVRPHSTHWSNSQQALGGGYLAAIFVQSGATGAPITCTVNVDGKVTNTETTSGAYGRAVCLG